MNGAMLPAHFAVGDTQLLMWLGIGLVVVWGLFKVMRLVAKILMKLILVLLVAAAVLWAICWWGKGAG